jgi:hypothetical protein
MSQLPKRRLTADDEGAEFRVVIEQLDNGQWQAAARVQVQSKSHVETQSMGSSCSQVRRRRENGLNEPPSHADSGNSN